MMEDLSVPVEFRMAEIERLRAELKQATGECYRLGHLNISHKAELDRLRAEKAAIEAATIERCARAVEARNCDLTSVTAGLIIRDLAKAANDPETESYEPPPYNWGKDKITE